MIAENHVNPMNKQIDCFLKISKLREKKNESSKETWTLTTTKSIIDQTNINDLKISISTENKQK